MANATPAGVDAKDTNTSTPENPGTNTGKTKKVKTVALEKAKPGDKVRMGKHVGVMTKPGTVRVDY